MDDLKMNENFFKEEVRCDFTVSSEMKRFWAAGMMILADIEKICNKYGLTYYADFGTLLGAVRHKGFVPWDDDIDICLVRSDYDKLLRALRTELPDNYVIYSPVLDGGNSQPFSRVFNGRKPIPDDWRTEHYCGCPYIVGVDIFPLDCVNRDEGIYSAQLGLYNAIYDLAQGYDKYEERGESEQLISQIEELCSATIIRGEASEVVPQLWRLADKIAKISTEAESDHYTEYWRCVSEKEVRFDKSWFKSRIMMPFEDILIPVPCGFREVLTQWYGDYSTPVKYVAWHDYPCFKSQKEIYSKYHNE